MLLPTIFDKIGGKTMYIFGSVNVISIFIVWALYPETNQRTLEEMNMVFASDSIWNWEAEKNFKILKEQNPELEHATRRKQSIVDDEMGVKTGHGRGVTSLVTREKSEEGSTEEDIHKMP